MSRPLHPDFPWIHISAGGFDVLPGDFRLDPQAYAARAVISHAHADHYPRSLFEVHAHPATLDLAHARYKSGAGKHRHAHAYYEPFRMGGVEITLLPAGHMLGSAQILLEYAGQRVLWSGDISGAAGALCAPLDSRPHRPDLVIAESTFGEKDAHQDPEAALRQAVEAARGRPILLAVYAMGKAQRLNYLLHRLFPELPVYVHRDILPFHYVYESHDISPGAYQPWNQRKAAQIRGSYVYLVPPMALSGYKGDVRYYKLFVSGFGQRQRFPWLDGQLEISDHCSQQELIQYLRDIQPAQAAFWHGYPEPLLDACRGLNIPAFPVTLPQIGNRR